jgi:hypothetical protein
MPLPWPSSWTSCLAVVLVLPSSGVQADVSSTHPCPTRSQRGRACPVRHPPSGVASAILNMSFVWPWRITCLLLELFVDGIQCILNRDALEIPSGDH